MKRATETGLSAEDYTGESMKHLLDTKDLTYEQAILLLDTAKDFAEIQCDPTREMPSLKGKRVVNFFYEDSTRTRISFEQAAKRLGLDIISFSAKGSSVSKGESLKDTALTLNAMGIDAAVIRHSASGSPFMLAHSGWINVPVLNAGDGTHAHPTQALLDAYTIRERVYGAAARGKGLDGVKVLIVGDVLHSRVARSNMWLLHLLGAEPVFVAPKTLLPHSIAAWPVRVYNDFDKAIAEVNPDAVMMLRVQHERMHASFFPSAHDYSANWGLTLERFASLDERTLIMHPGPMNRGLEICDEAADSAQSTVCEQVANGVLVRMAALYLLLNNEGDK